MIATLIRAGLFALFVILAILARRSQTMTRVFIAFFFVASLAGGLSQRDLWPFSCYPIFAEDALRYRESTWVELRGVASDGAEFRLRENAYAPLATATVEKWIERHPDVLRDPRVRQFLLTANDHRTLLGPIAAGDTVLARGGARATRPVAIRVYGYRIGGRTLLVEIR